MPLEEKYCKKCGELFYTEKSSLCDMCRGKQKKNIALKKTSRISRVKRSRGKTGEENRTGRYRRKKIDKEAQLRNQKILYGVLFFLLCMTIGAVIFIVQYEKQLKISRINLGLKAMKIAHNDRHTFPDQFDLQKYMYQLNYMAQILQKSIHDSMTPTEVIEVIKKYLYKNKRFVTSQNGWDPSNLYLNLILEGRQGYCLGYAQLWLALAERITWRGKNLPIYGVLVPYHIFCRWDGAGERINIETLHTPPPDYKPSAVSVLIGRLFYSENKSNLEAGRNIPDSYYLKRYGITEESIRQNIYLCNVNKRVVISSIYSNRAYLQIERFDSMKDPLKRAKQMQKVQKDIDIALKWYPKNILALRSKASILTQYKGEHKKALKIAAPLEYLDPCAKTFYLLYFIHVNLESYKKALYYLGKAEKAKAFSQTTLDYISYCKAYVYLLQKKYKKALEVCKAEIEKAQKDKNFVKIYTLTLLVVDVYIEQKHYQEAIKCAQLLEQLYGENDSLLLAYGKIYSGMKQWEKAKKKFKEVLWHSPKDIDALYGMGLYHEAQKEYMKALKNFKKTVLFDINFKKGRKKY